MQDTRILFIHVAIKLNRRLSLKKSNDRESKRRKPVNVPAKTRIFKDLGLEGWRGPRSSVYPGYRFWEPQKYVRKKKEKYFYTGRGEKR